MLIFRPRLRTGAMHLVIQRILDQYGGPFLAETVDLLATNDAHTLVDGWARDDRPRYEALRFVIYLSYYQQPEVIAALQRLGHDYNIAPQPLGYVLPPFDRHAASAGRTARRLFRN